MGMTRARVTQLLHLCDLAPAVRSEVVRLIQGGAKVSERTLRPLLFLPAAEQLRGLRCGRR